MPITANFPLTYSVFDNMWLMKHSFVENELQFILKPFYTMHFNIKVIIN